MGLHLTTTPAPRSNEPLAVVAVTQFEALLAPEVTTPDGIARLVHESTLAPYLSGAFGYVTRDRETADDLMKTTGGYLLDVTQWDKPGFPETYAIATADEAKTHWGRTAERLADIDDVDGDEVLLTYAEINHGAPTWD